MADSNKARLKKPDGTIQIFDLSKFDKANADAAYTLFDNKQKQRADGLAKALVNYKAPVTDIPQALLAPEGMAKLAADAKAKGVKSLEEFQALLRLVLEDTPLDDVKEIGKAIWAGMSFPGDVIDEAVDWHKVIPRAIAQYRKEKAVAADAADNQPTQAQADILARAYVTKEASLLAGPDATKETAKNEEGWGDTLGTGFELSWRWLFIKGAATFNWALGGFKDWDAAQATAEEFLGFKQRSYKELLAENLREQDVESTAPVIAATFDGIDTIAGLKTAPMLAMLSGTDKYAGYSGYDGFVYGFDKQNFTAHKLEGVDGKPLAQKTLDAKKKAAEEGRGGEATGTEDPVWGSIGQHNTLTTVGGGLLASRVGASVATFGANAITGAVRGATLGYADGMHNMRRVEKLAQEAGEAAVYAARKDAAKASKTAIEAQKAAGVTDAAELRRIGAEASEAFLTPVRAQAYTTTHAAELQKLNATPGMNQTHMNRAARAINAADAIDHHGQSLNRGLNVLKLGASPSRWYDIYKGNDPLNAKLPSETIFGTLGKGPGYVSGRWWANTVHDFTNIPDQLAFGRLENAFDRSTLRLGKLEDKIAELGARRSVTDPALRPFEVKINEAHNAKLDKLEARHATLAAKYDVDKLAFEAKLPTAPRGTFFSVIGEVRQGAPDLVRNIIGDTKDFFTRTPAVSAAPYTPRINIPAAAPTPAAVAPVAPVVAAPVVTPAVAAPVVPHVPAAASTGLRAKVASFLGGIPKIGKPIQAAILGTAVVGGVMATPAIAQTTHDNGRAKDGLDRTADALDFGSDALNIGTAGAGLLSLAGVTTTAVTTAASMPVALTLGSIALPVASVNDALHAISADKASRAVPDAEALKLIAMVKPGARYDDPQLRWVADMLQERGKRLAAGDQDLNAAIAYDAVWATKPRIMQIGKASDYASLNTSYNAMAAMSGMEGSGVTVTTAHIDTSMIEHAKLYLANKTLAQAAAETGSDLTKLRAFVPQSRDGAAGAADPGLQAAARDAAKKTAGAMVASSVKLGAVRNGEAPKAPPMLARLGIDVPYVDFV